MKEKEFQVPEILTVKQLADYLQMDDHTIYRLAKSGKIPAMPVPDAKSIVEESLSGSCRSLSKSEKVE